MIDQEFKLIDGIKIFHDDVICDHNDYHSTSLEQLYLQEEKHFWFLARKKLIFQKMKNIINFSSRVIEVGAGTGNVTRHLKVSGYNNISVGEMHIKGLKYAQEYGVCECYQFDMLRAPFKEEFDVVCLFDVLEHIEDDNCALLNANKMLRKSGYIVLTVPAHQWLWSRDDRIANHKRRYVKKELCDKLLSNGFKIISSHYFFITIIPLLYLRAVINRDSGKPVSDAEYEQKISINPLMNKMLYFISNFENKFSALIPNLFGGSIFIVARKRQFD